MKPDRREGLMGGDGRVHPPRRYGDERSRRHNAPVHRAAANDCQSQNPRGSRLRCNGLLCRVFVLTDPHDASAATLPDHCNDATHDFDIPNDNITLHSSFAGRRILKFVKLVVGLHLRDQFHPVIVCFTKGNSLECVCMFNRAERCTS
jgi:hypothetical protein